MDLFGGGDSVLVLGTRDRLEDPRGTKRDPEQESHFRLAGPED